MEKELKGKSGDYTVVIYNNNRGYFEHETCEALCGGLWFENNKLVDYDGVYSLPYTVYEILKSFDIDMSYIDNNPTFVKAYISGKFEKKDEIQKIVDSIKKHKIFCNARWLSHVDCKPYNDNNMISGYQAIEDLEDIDNCDIFVFVYHGQKGPGMFFELGYAYKSNKPIIVVGDDVENSSMFMHLPNIKICKSFDKLGEVIYNIYLEKF